MSRRGLTVGLATVTIALFVGVMPAWAAAAPSPEGSTSTTTTTTTTTTPPAPETTAPTTTTVPGPTTTPRTTQPPSGAPSTQANPAVTVTPSTALVHLQSVTISGTGFTPNTAVGFAECKNNNSGSANDCDVNHTGVATTNASGAFSAPFVVRRILHTANGDVDCASAPEECNVGVGKISDTSEHAGAPLTFDPNAPLPPPPTLLAGPLTGLEEGSGVALFGGGFVPSGQVAIVECSQPTAATCQILKTLTASAGGGFITTVTVHRVLSTPPFGATDCATAPDTCRLTAVSLSDYDFNAHVFLEFDPNGPLPAAEAAVTPDSDLLNFQSVTVAGSGFPASTGVQITQCKTDAASPADCNPGSTYASTDGAGTFSQSVTVRRVLHLQSGDVDCADAPGACSLVSSGYGTTPVVVPHPLDFDATAPLPPPPSISVSPDSDLVQGQSVTVTGANFPPNTSIGLGQCVTSTPVVPYCGFSGLVTTTDSNGAFTQPFSVRRGVVDVGTAFPPGVVDCAESVGRCSLVAASLDGGDEATHALGLDPSVPIPVPDTSVSPRLGLPDRALVHVHSSGFSSGERVLVSECIAGAPTYGSSCLDSAGPVTVLQADGDGVVDTSIRVRRQITPSGGVVIVLADGTTNCSDAVGACVLRVQSVDDPLVVSDVGLGFDPTAVAPPPSLTVTPAGPYTDGQQVEVHGSGFTPNATIGLAQCRTDVAPTGTSCDSGDGGLFTPFRADGDGSFTRTLTLHTRVETTAGPLDCGIAGACELFAANRNDYGAERTALPIEFEGAVTGVDILGATSGRALAFTGAGASTTPTAVVGFALLLLGSALVLLARRRPTVSS